MISSLKYLYVIFYLQLSQSLRHTSISSHQASRTESLLFFQQKIDMIAASPVKSMKVNPKKRDDNNDDQENLEDDTSSILPKQTAAAAASNSSNLSLTFSQLKPFLDIATPFFRDDKTARNSLIAVVALTLLNSGLSISLTLCHSLFQLPLSHMFSLYPSLMTFLYISVCFLLLYLVFCFYDSLPLITSTRSQCGIQLYIS